MTLAAQLGTPVVEFPGDHGGFLALPEQFGRLLATWVRSASLITDLGICLTGDHIGTNPAGQPQRPWPCLAARGAGVMVFTGSGCSGSSCSCHSACEILTAGAADFTVRLSKPGGPQQPRTRARGSRRSSQQEKAQWLRAQ